jgi:hypothetical protein
MAAFVYIQGSTALSQKNIVGHIGVGLCGAAIGYWLYGQPAVINAFVGALGGFGIFGAAALLLLL